MTTPSKEELIQNVVECINSIDEPVIFVGVAIDDLGNFVVIENPFSASKATVYQTIGLLDQIKLDLLATVPENRPLREPVEEDDLDTDMPPIAPTGGAPS